MRGKRGLHMHHVKVGAGETAIQFGQATPVHQAVFRIQRHGARRQADNAGCGIGGVVVSGIPGGYHGDSRAKAGERGAEGLDRGRYAIDAGEVDVAQHQHVQRAAVVPDDIAVPVGQDRPRCSLRHAHAAMAAAGLRKCLM